MKMKGYDLVIMTADAPDAGATADVWLRLTGSAADTGWFNFRQDEDGKRRIYFRPGSIEYATFRFHDLGVLESCSLELRSDKDGSWLPLCVEVIDSDESWVWQFGDWVRTGSITTKKGPTAEFPFDQACSDSNYDNAMRQATGILGRVESQWRQGTTGSPRPAQVLDEIVAIFEKAALLRKRG